MNHVLMTYMRCLENTESGWNLAVEKLGLADLTHDPKGNKMRAK